MITEVDSFASQESPSLSEQTAESGTSSPGKYPESESEPMHFNNMKGNTEETNQKANSTKYFHTEEYRPTIEATNGNEQLPSYPYLALSFHRLKQLHLEAASRNLRSGQSSHVFEPFMPNEVQQSTSSMTMNPFKCNVPGFLPPPLIPPMLCRPPLHPPQVLNRCIDYTYGESVVKSLASNNQTLGWPKFQETSFQNITNGNSDICG